MIDFFSNPNLILLIGLLLAFSSFLSSNPNLSALFLLLESLVIIFYYYFTNLLNTESLFVIMLIIFSCCFVYVLSYYFTKSTHRKWQKNTKSHTIIGIIILVLIYIKKDFFSFLNSGIEIKKNDLIIDEFFILYSTYFILIITVCSVIIINNKNTKRR